VFPLKGSSVPCAELISENRRRLLLPARTFLIAVCSWSLFSLSYHDLHLAGFPPVLSNFFRALFLAVKSAVLHVVRDAILTISPEKLSTMIWDRDSRCDFKMGDQVLPHFQKPHFVFLSTTFSPRTAV